MLHFKIYLDVSGTIGHIGSDLMGIGVEGVNEFAHSDTLFSAIIHGMANCYEKSKIDELFEKFNLSIKSNDETLLPFRCSSAFLSNKTIDFVPRPLCPPPFENDIPGLNKLRFISFNNLRKWLKLESINSQQDFTDSLFEEKRIYSNLFIERIRAVNSKDRIRNLTQVYHRGEVIYDENAYLYFWLDVQENYWPFINDALTYIQECAGLGGECAIGFSEINGFSPIEDQLPVMNDAKFYYLFSLLPLNAKIIYEKSYYDVINRKSRINSPFYHIIPKKNAIKMLREGSCLMTSQPTGCLVDVTPKSWEKFKKDNNGQKDDPKWHKVYRNGLGFYLGYK